MNARLFCMQFALLATALMVKSTPSSAQDPAASRPTRKAPVREVQVVDEAGQPIPYAMVSIGNSPPKVADVSGVAQLPMPVDSDSAELVVRRIGYAPFGDWADLDPEGVRFEVRLRGLPRALNPVTVVERRDTPLARRGFYDRLERVSRGATVGRFITPEELELRATSQLSGVLAAEPYIRIQRTNGKPILTGRQHSCGMQVVVDGMRMAGMVEEVYSRDGQDEIRRMGGGPQATARFLQNRLSVDEIISTLSVAAVEIYPSAAGAPPEVQRAAGASACGVIMIWTGDRK